MPSTANNFNPVFIFTPKNVVKESLNNYCCRGSCEFVRIRFLNHAKTVTGMPSKKLSLDRLANIVANEISDIIETCSAVRNTNRILITSPSTESGAYVFDVKGLNWQFALRFNQGQAGPSLEFLANPSVYETLPDSVKRAYQKIVTYATNSKNTNVKERFENKYAAFLKELEDRFSSVVDNEIVFQGNKFAMKGSDLLHVADIYLRPNNQVRIFVRDVRMPMHIRDIADRYKDEFDVVCSQSHIVTRAWQARPADTSQA